MNRREPIYKKVSDYSEQDKKPNDYSNNTKLSEHSNNKSNISNNTVISITTQQELLNYIQNYRIVLVDVWAKWCGPCKHFTPKFEELANNCSDIKEMIFLKDDIDNENSPHSTLVSAVPTFFLYTDHNTLAKKIFVGDYDKFENLVLNIYERLKSQK
jgi:thiol-disulfide isomerase/thioredoxin